MINRYNNIIKTSGWKERFFQDIGGGLFGAATGSLLGAGIGGTYGSIKGALDSTDGDFIDRLKAGAEGGLKGFLKGGLIGGGIGSGAGAAATHNIASRARAGNAAQFMKGLKSYIQNGNIPAELELGLKGPAFKNWVTNLISPDLMKRMSQSVEENGIDSLSKFAPELQEGLRSSIDAVSGGNLPFYGNILAGATLPPLAMMQGAINVASNAIDKFGSYKNIDKDIKRATTAKLAAYEKTGGYFENRIGDLMAKLAPKFQEGVFKKLSPELQEFMTKGLANKMKGGLADTAMLTGLGATPFGALAGLYHTYTTGGEGEDAPGLSDYLRNSLIGAGISGTMGAAIPTALRYFSNDMSLKNKLKHMEHDFLSDTAEGNVSHYLDTNSDWVTKWRKKYNIR